MRVCAHPTCSTLVHKGRCAVHARVLDRARGTAQARGYDAAWATYSKHFRAKYPICGMRTDGQLHAEHSRCVQEGRTTAAECVDHIQPMSRGGDKWSPLNHQSLCTRCNRVKGDQ